MTDAATGRPAFLVTVDTEGDNLWARPKSITAENAKYLPRLQSLCEKYRLKPTYFTNWEMSQSQQFGEFGRDVLERGAGEVGMHLHAWNSPPIIPLTSDDFHFQPYLIEYPPDQIREKVRVMTETLAHVFGQRPTSHRSGRWGFDETYARILIEQGYTADCSVTPHVNWRFCKGDPRKPGGSNYTRFPASPYFVDPADIARPGDSPLLELPVTVIHTRRYPGPIEALRERLSGSFFGTRIMRKAFPNTAWLMPTGSNGREMAGVLEAVRRENRSYAQFVIHSSELMPGGSPKLPGERAIDQLYEQIEALFAAATDFAGQTVAEFRRSWSPNPSIDRRVLFGIDGAAAFG